MRLRTFLKPLSFLPAILMMYVIFTFSGQEGTVSSATSYRICSKIVRTVNDVADLKLEEYQIENYIERIHGASRKIAHVTEYFLLAVSVAFPLYVYGMHGILLVLVCGLFCVAFACSDEYHQSLVAGRAASVRDVYIDSAGILLGILLVRIIGWTGRMTLFRPSREEAARQEIERLERRVAKMERQKRARGQAPTERSSRQQAPAARSAREQAPAGRSAREQTRYDPYDSYEPDEPSSDELSEDMPFAGLFRKK